MKNGKLKKETKTENVIYTKQVWLFSFSKATVSCLMEVHYISAV